MISQTPKTTFLRIIANLTIKPNPYTMPDYTDQVVNNVKKYRFEVVSGSQVSKLEYRLGRYTLDLVHTEVPEQLTDQGIGSSLVEAALNHARANGLKVIPSCPFVAAYLERHPEWEDIVVEV